VRACTGRCGGAGEGGWRLHLSTSLHLRSRPPSHSTIGSWLPLPSSGSCSSRYWYRNSAFSGMYMANAHDPFCARFILRARFTSQEPNDGSEPVRYMAAFSGAESWIA